MRNLFGWSIVAALLLTGVAGAQQPRPGLQPVQPVRPGQPAQPGQQPVRPGQPGVAQPGVIQPGVNNQATQLNDQQISAVIAICNRHEVEIVKYALPKLKSDKAKELATAMIKDHTEAADKFSRLAGQVGAVNSSAPRREGDQGREEGRREEGRREERREEGRREGDRADDKKADAPRNAATAPNNPGTRVAAQAETQPRTAFRPVAGGALNWVAIHQEISDEGLAACKKEMSKYEGNEFDKAFLGGQLAGHMKAATELKVFRRHVSNQLGSEIDSALATTEEHLKELRDLMNDKKDEGNK